MLTEGNLLEILVIVNGFGIIDPKLTMKNFKYHMMNERGNKLSQTNNHGDDVEECHVQE